MAWTNDDITRVYTVIRAHVVNDYKYESLDDATQDGLIQDSVIYAWNEQKYATPVSWYLKACVRSVAYNQRLICAEKQNKKLKNSRAKFTSLEVEMTSRGEEGDYNGWEPEATAVYFHSDFEFMDTLLEKGSKFLTHAVKEIVQNSATIAELADSMGIDGNTIRYRLRIEIASILGRTDLIDSAVIERTSKKKSVKKIQVVEEDGRSFIADLFGQMELAF